MRPTLLQRMDQWVRHLLPVGVTLLLLLVNVTPARIPDYATVAPILTLMSVFYWSIYRPDLLPSYAAFAVGLLFDVISGGPLGVNALVLLLVQGITASQRRFFLGNAFPVAWWGFAMMAGGAVTAAWMLVAVLLGSPIGLRPVLFEYMLTVALYPLLSWAMARTQVAFLKQA